jgi:translocation and assembly module TamA
VQLQIFQSDDTRRGTRIQQRGLSIEASKVALQRTRWSVRYEYKISECKDSPLCNVIDDELPIEDFPRDLLDIQISSITPTFFWDTRDDIIDPHRGFFTSASIEYAFPVFSAEARFLKEYVQGTWYLPISRRTVVALSGRAGLIQPHGGTTSDNVPLSERFTAGGEITHRAFRLDLLGELCRGPEEDRYAEIMGCEPTLFATVTENEDGTVSIGPILPRGGSGMLLLNAEYRFPIFSTLGGAVFVDAGNVYKRDTIDFDSIRYGVGLGLRYLSPVGPIRIDVARPFDRRWYEDSWQYFITLGYAF